MPADLLLDTGALVALLDASERRHTDCTATFSAWNAGVVTTEAVVTEAAYLLASAGADGTLVPLEGTSGVQDLSSDLSERATAVRSCIR